MNTQLSLVCTFALVAIPLLPACGDNSGNWNGSSSGGAEEAGGGGNDSGGAGSSSSGDGAARDGGGGGPSYEAGSGSGGDATAGSPDTGAGGGAEAGDDSSGGNGGADGAPGDGAIVTPTTKVVMYLPNWSGSYASWATMIDFNKMTHLNLAFGTVNGNNGWDLGAQDSDVQTLAAAAHTANVKVLVSIGGADGDISIINAYQSSSNIAPLVANLDAMVKRLNLDGVDVDLERGNMMQSSSNFPAFVGQLMSTFHPEGKLVTAALAQYIVQDANPDPMITSVVNSFDFINDMIYTTNISDYTNESAWWTSTVNLPKDKLVWGILFGNGLSTDTAKQITMGSKGYGGVMVWEYTQPTEPQLWPAIQSVL